VDDEAGEVVELGLEEAAEEKMRSKDEGILKELRGRMPSKAKGVVRV
jgi:hypothetical protein